MLTKAGTEYTHQKLGENYYGLAGYYTPLREVVVPINGREIIYIIGRAVIESSCCGSGAWGYVLVPGYLLEQQRRTNEDGLPVSEVEPIVDTETKNSLSQLIREREGTDCISFW